mmetsp:Transcript_11996/g.33803  ORF Transcript_11996/g.33803 Transcript_11996/m.33803 type:complete len:615 (+) Transcript_11996:109-1953(+)|eukprot:CAMPEP_0119129334 /NCGR_PEP_ID=MMETSP1310-20130426/7130_1 /TAXON_ID=464262 /ORGANISM="Genus nov. species nov., Strain RCC2339" /LENGTH=614 /DNA_ID=CAMNT_0007119753 /DNA_START=83 /DNA_END=1927 /DNA_ORIENTATION=-
MLKYAVWGTIAGVLALSVWVAPVAVQVIVGCVCVLLGVFLTNTGQQEAIDKYAEAFHASKSRTKNTDRFSPSKVPDNLDAIVIGSGSSGMTCASVLARTGRRVLVLEQHYVTGGGSHMFDLEGYQFDSGLHYTVPWSQQILHMVCGHRTAPVIFDKLGEEDGTFDKIVIGEQPEFRVKHKERHIRDLYAMFPENKADLDEYMRISFSAMNGMPLYALSRFLPQWLQGIYNHTVLRSFRTHAKQTAQDVLERITKNRHLSSLLCGLWLDTGELPTKSTFFLTACVFRGLPLEGGTYPRGGSEKISLAMIPVIEQAGGKVLCRAPVTEILVDEKTNRAVGVRVGGPKPMEIRAKMVISSVGYPNTFKKLVPKATVEKLKIPTELGVPASPGYLMCNVGIRAPADELDVTCANIWYHPADDKLDIFQPIQDFWENPMENDAPMMITFPSVKDRAWKDRFPDRTTCQMLVVTDYAWFAKWKAQLSGKRDEEYKKLKKQWETKCLRLLYRFFPKVEGKVDIVDVSTPLSIEFYLEEPRGGAVGLSPCPIRYSDPVVMKRLDIITPVKNLYMTGQDTFVCGQPCVQLAGLIAGLRILGFVEGISFIGDCIRNVLRVYNVV